MNGNYKNDCDCEFISVFWVNNINAFNYGYLSIELLHDDIALSYVRNSPLSDPKYLISTNSKHRWVSQSEFVRKFEELTIMKFRSWTLHEVLDK